MIRPSISQVYCLFKKKKGNGEQSHTSVSGRIQAEKCGFSFNSQLKMSFLLLAINSVISLEGKSLLHFSLVYNLKAIYKNVPAF